MTEKTQLSRMTTREAVAYRNICLMSQSMQGDRDRTARHLPIVEEILRERGIRFRSGRLLTTK